VRCPVCGEESLSPLAALDTSHWLLAHFKRPGFLEPRPAFVASHARLCRSCGAVLPFLDQQNREELAEQWDDLIPVAPDVRPETPRSPESPS
jgi:RNA polymerase subunit RPABC4/transcription elongation factor Spt4